MLQFYHQENWALPFTHEWQIYSTTTVEIVRTGMCSTTLVIKLILAGMFGETRTVGMEISFKIEISKEFI